MRRGIDEDQPLILEHSPKFARTLSSVGVEVLADEDGPGGMRLVWQKQSSMTPAFPRPGLSPAFERRPKRKKESGGNRRTPKGYWMAIQLTLPVLLAVLA
jgi:hypothetical protein